MQVVEHLLKLCRTRIRAALVSFKFLMPPSLRYPDNLCMPLGSAAVPLRQITTLLRKILKHTNIRISLTHIIQTPFNVAWEYGILICWF